MYRTDFLSFVSTSVIQLLGWVHHLLKSSQIIAAIYHLSKESQHTVCVWGLSYFGFVVCHFSTLWIKGLVPANENILWSLLIRNSAGGYTAECNMTRCWGYFVKRPRGRDKKRKQEEANIFNRLWSSSSQLLFISLYPPLNFQTELLLHFTTYLKKMSWPTPGVPEVPQVLWAVT